MDGFKYCILNTYIEYPPCNTLLSASRQKVWPFSSLWPELRFGVLFFRFTFKMHFKRQIKSVLKKWMKYRLFLKTFWSRLFYKIKGEAIFEWFIKISPQCNTRRVVTCQRPSLKRRRVSTLTFVCVSRPFPGCYKSVNLVRSDKTYNSKHFHCLCVSVNG